MAVDAGGLSSARYYGATKRTSRLRKPAISRGTTSRAPRRRVPAQRPSRSQGQNRGYGSQAGQGQGRGVRGTPGGAVPGGVPSIAAPNLAKYLAGDTAYQQTLRGGQRTLADFLSELGRQRSEATTQFTQTKGTMERDRLEQLENLKNEYASRGLLMSGLYGEKQGDFQQEFQRQMDMLNQSQTSLMQDLLGQERNFRREQELALEAARQEAIRRRAEQYGIV